MKAIAVMGSLAAAVLLSPWALQAATGSGVGSAAGRASGSAAGSAATRDARGAGEAGVAAATGATVSIVPSFSVNRLGARTAVTLRVAIAGGEDGVPPPVREASLHVPAGLAGSRLRWPTTAGCSGAHLQAHGAAGCPAHSQVGSGEALLAWHEGGTAVSTEHARLWAFVAPTDGEYALEILGEGARPVRRRVIMHVPLAVETGPFSADLEVMVPPIPAFPAEPDASIVSMTLTIGGAEPAGGHGGARGGLGIYVPRTCPAGGFPWRADVTFTDHATAGATAAIACP